MSKQASYEVVARAYAEGVRGLFAPSGPPSKERGAVRGPSSYEDLAIKAEKLSFISDDLTRLITSQLADIDPAVRMESSTRMLAKGLTDLEVSAQLIQAAEDETYNTFFEKSRGAERGAVGLGASPESLNILLGEDKAGRKKAKREGELSNTTQARAMLSTGIENTLMLISDRANETAQTAVGVLLGWGPVELAQAAGALGMDTAEILGQAERLSRLYELSRSFVGKVYDSLATLIGESLMQKTGQKVLEWMNEIKGGKQLGEILESLYQTKLTQEGLKKFVGDSQASLGKYTYTIQAVEGLEERYGTQVKLAEKLLKGFKFVGGLSDAVMPRAKLIFAAASIALGGYMILAGADYVDSPRLKWIDRVAGVRRTVEGELKVS